MDAPTIEKEFVVKTITFRNADMDFYRMNVRSGEVTVASDLGEEMQVSAKFFNDNGIICGGSIQIYSDGSMSYFAPGES